MNVAVSRTTVSSHNVGESIRVQPGRRLRPTWLNQVVGWPPLVRVQTTPWNANMVLYAILSGHMRSTCPRQRLFSGKRSCLQSTYIATAYNPTINDRCHRCRKIASATQVFHIQSASSPATHLEPNILSKYVNFSSVYRVLLLNKTGCRFKLILYE